MFCKNQKIRRGRCCYTRCKSCASLCVRVWGQLIGDALAGTVTKGRLGIDMLAAAISAQFISLDLIAER